MSDAGQVVGWLVKLVVVLVVLGLVLFEVVATVLVRATAADTASKAAQEAGFVYRDTSDRSRAEETARAMVEGEGAEFVSLSVDTEQRTISVTVQKRAKTLFIHKIDALKKYTNVSETQAAPLPSG